MLLLSTHALAGAVRAQPQNGTLTGTVRNGQGQPLPGASVVIEGTDRGDAAGPDGQYRLTIAPGTYRLRAYFVSHASQTVQVTVAAGATVTQGFPLKRALLEMDEVVTTASFNPSSKLASSVAITALSARDTAPTHPDGRSPTAPETRRAPHAGL